MQCVNSAYLSHYLWSEEEAHEAWERDWEDVIFIVRPSQFVGLTLHSDGTSEEFANTFRADMLSKFRGDIGANQIIVQEDGVDRCAWKAGWEMIQLELEEWVK